MSAAQSVEGVSSRKRKMSTEVGGGASHAEVGGGASHAEVVGGGGGAFHAQESRDRAPSLLVHVLAQAHLGHQACGALIRAMTGQMPNNSHVLSDHAMRVSTTAGVTLIPALQVGDDVTLRELKGIISAKCPQFNGKVPVVYVGTLHAEGRKAMQQVDACDMTGAALRALGDTLFVVVAEEHSMATTAIKAEYERGDINCPNCKKKGPARYTGHQHCTVCKLCGNCCLETQFCGGEVGVASGPLTEQQAKELADAKEAYLKEYYKWQRGIMKPY